MLISAAFTSTSAATITVTALNDTLINNGACSIREAIINANNDAATWPDCAAGSGTDDINLPAGVITLSIPNLPSGFTDENQCLTGDLDINSPMTINGHANGTTINGSDLDRIFDIDPDTDGDPTTQPPFIVDIAAAVARALCEGTGNPPAGYFVVGDGPEVNPHISVNQPKVRGGAAATSAGTAASAEMTTATIGPMTGDGFERKVVVSLPRLTIVDEEFGVKEYDDFHRVLHHLQHDALPKNDIATIRNQAKDLIKLGTAIVKLGIPAGTKEANLEAFKKELDRFAKALEKYGVDAESGSDADLKTSYSAVHDSFEELAALLPRK